jgi:hypothetical protein
MKKGLSLVAFAANQSKGPSPACRPGNGVEPMNTRADNTTTENKACATVGPYQTREFFSALNRRRIAAFFFFTLFGFFHGG